jgi:predicted RNase H-like HicB family nuclease
MEQEIKLNVHLAFDDEANVWYVAKTDIPGLILESESVEELIRRIQDAAPQMIELNAQEILDTYCPEQPVQKVSRARPPMSWLPVFDSALAVA